VTLVGNPVINGVGCGWVLGSALSDGNAGSSFTVTNGAFDTASYSVIYGGFGSSNSNTRAITLGSSTITIQAFLQNFATTINLTFNAGTSQINLTNATTSNGGGLTFYNVAFTATATGGIILQGANTFNNLSFTGRTSAGISDIQLTANQTINGTLTLSAGTDATMRTFVRSGTIGTTRTLTCAAFSGTDADFRDITIAGAAAPVSGTRLGDAKGNSGITFGAGVTRYWNLAGGGNWSGTGWAATSGGAPAANNFPLAQDTALFEATGLNSGATVTVDQAFNIGTINMSARTSNTMTLVTGSAFLVYGNWINGTGTTLSGASVPTFSGRGTQTITSAGVTWTQGISITTPGGSVTLQDAFVSNRASALAINLTDGTFNAATYNVTLTGSASGVNVTGTNAKTYAVGSGTWTIAGTAGWNASTSTNLTITGTGTISLTAATAKSFQGGSVSYSGITIDQGGAGTLTITGNNTFKSISNTYSATGATTIDIGTTTQTLTQPWTATGAAGRVLTVQGTSASSPGTLVFSNSGVGAAVDYLAVTGVRAYPLTTTWYAGTNSTNNGSLGWYFESGVAAIAAFVSETSTATDAISALLIAGISGFITETSTATDAVSAFLTFLASASESATATDSNSAANTVNPSLSETATGTDAINTVSNIFNPSLSEAATGTDAPSTANNTFNPSLAEAATGTDSPAANWTTSSAVSESATATDSTQSAVIFLGDIAETATVTDLAESLMSFFAQIAENSAITDVTLVAPSVFGPQIQEAIAALDLISTYGTFNVQFVDSATVLDAVIGKYLWNPVDDDQTPNWTVIADSQTPGWSNIADNQSPGWQNINTL
jgi:hypothetical protein